MKIRILYPALFSILIFTIFSCKKNNEADILQYEIIGQKTDVEISSGSKQINITFPESVTVADNLAAGFLLSEGATATVNGISQVSEQTRNNYEHSFSYLVRSEDKSKLTEWKVSATNNPQIYSWGLGGFLKSGLSNNQDYEWYLDQGNTGPYSYNNCGPASTTMAAKWSDPSFSRTPVDARAAYRPSGGWWYTNDVDTYLNDNGIPHFITNLSATASGTQLALTSQLDKGYIAILCLDMYYIRPEAFQTKRIDKFYVANSTGWGHFIVVKGYKMVDDQLYFEVYDPYCFNMTYTDGTLKGKNRYYRLSDIFAATFTWWNYSVIVTKKGAAKSEVRGLDRESIPNMWGR